MNQSNNQPTLIRARLLNRSQGSFGLTTQERSLIPPTLMVSDLQKNGEADLSGLIRPGDVIMKINDTDVSSCSFERALRVLASVQSGTVARFLVRAPFGYTTRLETTFTSDGTPRTLRITERIFKETGLESAQLPGHIHTISNLGCSPTGPANVNLSLVSATGLLGNGKKCEPGDGDNCGPGPGTVTPATIRRPIKLQNIASGQINVDTLHQNQAALENIGCTQKICSGSFMNPKTGNKRSRTPLELTQFAKNFFDQYFASIKRLNSPAHEQRWDQVVHEIASKATYSLTETELIFGAKLAWRNAPRCIGRIQWSKLQCCLFDISGNAINAQVFDARFVSTPREMFEAICNHIKYATNKGNLRSAITVFPQRTGDSKSDFRVWNPQLISYAGYADPQVPTKITGDPANVEFTQLCEKMGWLGKKSRWDILPLVLSANGQDPQLFLIPEELVLRVHLKHPKYQWFEEMALQWYAVPAVSGMLLDVGGIEFPGVPFSGWYMVTEIACRDLCDTNRYNILEEVAIRMGLDVRSNATLWKDSALVEINVAVLDSFQKAGVTIVDHHTASESFIKHLENEQRLRGGCPADWVWVVPPTGGSLTPVFHQEMLYYEMKPSYEYQEFAWRSHEWQNPPGAEKHTTPMRKKKFKEIARAVKFTSNLFGKALSKRIKATILFATETGRSEHYAKRLAHIFSHVFNVNVLCMDSYDTFHLEHEALLLIVTSTFGNGDPPENGEAFARQLQAIKVTGDTTPDIESVRSVSMSYLRISSTESIDVPNSPPYEDTVSQVGPLSNIRFSVFALGSSAYPNFCAFGRFVDNMLAELGGERISRVMTGDELSGQEQSFGQWTKKVFEEACEVFCIGDDLNLAEVMKSATLKPLRWSAANVRLQPIDPTSQPLSTRDIVKGLSTGYNRKVVQLKLKKITPLYEGEGDGRQTIQVQLDSFVENNEVDTVMTYMPGDHLGVFPENNQIIIEDIKERLADVDFETRLQVLTKRVLEEDGKEEWTPHERLPATSLREALTRYLDITTPPTQQFLGSLSSFCQREEEEKELQALSSDSARYESWKASKYPNLLEVLKEFTSLKPPPELLLTQLPSLQPRFYSISSSPLYNNWATLASSDINAIPNRTLSRTKSVSRSGTPTNRKSGSNSSRTEPGTPTGAAPTPLISTSGCSRIDLTVAVVQYKKQSGYEHLGVCSNFLANLKPGYRLFGFIRNAPNFRLPDDSTTPIIMVGPGTGIAPFRSFWLHRYAASLMNPTEKSCFGNMTLFFGCRLPSVHLYRDETQKMMDEGILTQVFTAFSRAKGQPKHYVQDYLRKASKEVFHQIMRQKGHFYVCGDVSMAEDVCKTLKMILQENGVSDQDSALMKLREEMRIHEDIYGKIYMEDAKKMGRPFDGEQKRERMP